MTQDTVCVHFITMGCAKNEVDTQDMETRLRKAGFSIVDAAEDAHCVVVNTCSFIQSATEESLAAIFDVTELPGFVEGETRLVVAGCMPARYGEELRAELGEVSSFVPCSKEDDIVEILRELYPSAGDDAVSKPSVAEGMPAAISEYVKISDGCDRYCTYCTIPFIRGHYHSFSMESIIDDIRDKTSRGAREVVLIAQDTGLWGTDFDTPDSLAHLLECIAVEFPKTWVRVMYLQPNGITDELLSTMAGHDNICNYFDIPLQHADRSILKAMNRTDDGPYFLETIERIRTRIPDVCIRTTLIAGFPGETEESFETLCDFVEDAEFDYVGVFPYSQEEGTVAAGLPDQVDEEVKLERAQRIRDIADAVSTARMASKIGTSVDVLVLGAEEDGQLYGRTQGQAPDVDGIVYIDDGEPASVISVRLIDSLLYILEGERQ